MGQGSGFLNEAVEALFANEAKYRLLFETIQEASLLAEAILDEQGAPKDWRILEVNPAFSRITGVAREQAVGSTLLTLDPGLQAHWLEACRKVAFGVEALTVEGPAGPHGRSFRAMLYSPHPGQFAALFSDITDHVDEEARKHAEGALRESEARLKALDTVQMARRLEAVGRLARGVAQDFEALQGRILTHTGQALADPGLPEGLAGALKEIQMAADRSADLTRQLLAFARKEGGHPRAVALESSFAGLLKVLLRLVGEDIALSVQGDRDLWPVRIDPGQVDQILVNLVLNARDASPGVGRITLEARNVTLTEAECVQLPEALPGDHVRLAVRDDGQGLDEASLGHLFEPFFPPGEAGAGLGLAAVYGLVRRNGGFVQVASQPGMGTTISVHLPRWRGEVPPEPLPSLPLGTGETVFLVEEGDTQAALAHLMLEQLGYQVLAGTPRQLAKEHPERPDLLVTPTPQADLRALLPGVPCLCLADTLEGGPGALPSPFSLRELAVRLREVLAGG